MRLHQKISIYRIWKTDMARFTIIVCQASVVKLFRPCWLRQGTPKRNSHCPTSANTMTQARVSWLTVHTEPVGLYLQEQVGNQAPDTPETRVYVVTSLMDNFASHSLQTLLEELVAGCRAFHVSEAERAGTILRSRRCDMIAKVSPQTTIALDGSHCRVRTTDSMG